MEGAKYFDWKKKRTIDHYADGCDFMRWMTDSDNFNHAIHKEGFLIFLSAEEIFLTDEYKDGDPYGIENNINSPFHKGRVKCVIELLEKVVNSSQKRINLLDIGCGQGHVTAKVKSVFPFINVYGLDISLKAIEYAHNNYKGIDFVVADAHNPPYLESFFDIIICTNTWEHVPDPVKMLLNIKKVLRKDGVIIMSTPSRYRTSNLLKVLLGKRPSINNQHITEYSINQVIEQFNFADFKVIKTLGLGLVGQGGAFLTRFFVHKLFKTFALLLIKLTKSNHILDSTVFYLAKKA